MIVNQVSTIYNAGPNLYELLHRAPVGVAKGVSPEQILIFRNEDYTVDKKGTLTNIFRFLDVGECSSVIHTGAKH
ncbi:hypothetical protein DPMN_106960 [Dreissena polymorpha]|uniref:Uncharacterized protein n=1 Tax=Dreissena polymorpha TaxID=45954 RepID=A0A9D4K5V8_DREPO|nr:hypothetical protein DPMN_106960 [Dreissena polymorpha]